MCRQYESCLNQWGLDLYHLNRWQLNRCSLVPILQVCTLYTYTEILHRVVWYLNIHLYMQTEYVTPLSYGDYTCEVCTCSLELVYGRLSFSPSDSSLASLSLSFLFSFINSTTFPILNCTHALSMFDGVVTQLVFTLVLNSCTTIQTYSAVWLPEGSPWSTLYHLTSPYYHSQNMQSSLCGRLLRLRGENHCTKDQNMHAASCRVLWMTFVTCYIKYCLFTSPQGGSIDCISSGPYNLWWKRAAHRATVLQNLQQIRTSINAPSERYCVQ